MLPTKRKLGVSGLERRVRPRKDEDSDVEVDSDDAPSEQNVGGDESDEDESEGDEDDDSNEEESDDESAADEKEEPQIDISAVSFGDLAKAHKALSSKDKSSSTQQEEPSSSYSSFNARDEAAAIITAKARRRIEDKKKMKRSSKHAPTEMTATRPVSRKRDFLSAKDTTATGSKPAAPRDPRFDPLTGRFDEARFKHAYAFLDTYRDDEMAALRKQIKKTKDEAKKEGLKRSLMSMESRKLAEQKREQERKVLEEHRQREKDMVKEGKKPFYLKRSEQKKMVLKERFEGMSKGQVDKAIMRRRKKIAGKDKKELGSLEMASERRKRVR